MEQLKHDIVTYCTPKPIVIACWMIYAIVGFNIAGFCVWFDVYYMDFVKISSLVMLYCVVHTVLACAIMYLLSYHNTMNLEWFRTPKYAILLYLAFPSIYTTSMALFSTMRIDQLGSDVQGSFFAISVMHIMILVSALVTTLLYNLCLDMEKKTEAGRKKPTPEVDSTNKTN